MINHPGDREGRSIPIPNPNGRCLKLAGGNVGRLPSAVAVIAAVAVIPTGQPWGSLCSPRSPAFSFLSLPVPRPQCSHTDPRRIYPLATPFTTSSRLVPAALDEPPLLSPPAPSTKVGSGYASLAWLHMVTGIRPLRFTFASSRFPLPFTSMLSHPSPLSRADPPHFW